MTARTELFRREVAQARAERLQGTVSIVTPVGWQLVGFLLLASVVVTAAFLASASYARVVTVQGVIALDRGVAAIMPSRSGTIERIGAREGQVVRSGQPLVSIRAEEDMADGSTAPGMVREALREQDDRLAAQSGLVENAARADAARLAAQIAGASDEVASLDAQISDQQRLVDAAVAEYGRAEDVARQGFISRRDMEGREATILSRRQQLAQLRQLRSAKLAEANEARGAIAQSGATAMAQVAATATQRASLRERLAESEGSAGYVIRAPVAGLVTALTARVGQRAEPGAPLALVVPRAARTTAELFVPTSSAGFLSRGQRIRLAIDAFPYQQFGTVQTTVDLVSRAAVSRKVGDTVVPGYLVTGFLPDPVIRAFGRPQPLLPGMTLTARITTERRSLLEWLFEPLFAVRNR